MRRQHGAALATSLLFLVIMTLLGLAAMRSGTIGLRLSQNEGSRLDAQQNAQTLLEAISNRSASFTVLPGSDYIQSCVIGSSLSASKLSTQQGFSCPSANADTALLAGLLQGVGRLYLLTRAVKFPLVLADPATFQRIVADLHGRVAQTILRNWEIIEDVVVAVVASEDMDREHEGAIDLTDVLAVSGALVSLGPDPVAEQMLFLGMPAARRMISTKVLRHRRGGAGAVGVAVDGGLDLEDLHVLADQSPHPPRRVVEVAGPVALHQQVVVRAHLATMADVFDDAGYPASRAV